jgi:hypothetical protein
MRHSSAHIVAAPESFVATLECELIDRYRFPSPAEARIAIFRFIEGWVQPAPAATLEVAAGAWSPMNASATAASVPSTRPQPRRKQINSLAHGRCSSKMGLYPMVMRPVMGTVLPSRFR